ncbi:MAG TPA: transcription antitermination factor NusB [bacterium]|nr:transcription antitermination factor NusB [bacterium]
MGNKHKAREIAIQLIYQLDAVGGPVEEALKPYFAAHPVNSETRAFAEEFVSGTAANIESIDSLLRQVSEHWSLERILPVDLAILRLGAFELLYFGTAPAIAIDEAVRLAKHFSSKEASAFINGVLDKVKELGLVGAEGHAASGEQP